MIRRPLTGTLSLLLGFAIELASMEAGAAPSPVLVGVSGRDTVRVWDRGETTNAQRSQELARSVLRACGCPAAEFWTMLEIRDRKGKLVLRDRKGKLVEPGDPCTFKPIRALLDGLPGYKGSAFFFWALAIPDVAGGLWIVSGDTLTLGRPTR